MSGMKDTLTQGLDSASNAISDIKDQISDTIVDQTGLRATTTVSLTII